MIAELLGAVIAVLYGAFTAFQKKTPLFYWIIVLAMVTCLMGNIYTVLYEVVCGIEDNGFHVGYLGSIGMFFFLHSSYYGALDSLADGKQPDLRKYRIGALLVSVCFLLLSSALLVFLNKGFWMYILLIPMGFTLYFATKHLIIPDVDMGIIKVMRWYNAVIIGLCVVMMLSRLSEDGSVLKTVSSIGTGLLLAVCLPVARNGVRKWFI